MSDLLSLLDVDRLDVWNFLPCASAAKTKHTVMNVNNRICVHCSPFWIL